MKRPKPSHVPCTAMLARAKIGSQNKKLLELLGAQKY
jgi:hypothetical protein